MMQDFEGTNHALRSSTHEKGDETHPSPRSMARLGALARLGGKPIVSDSGPRFIWEESSITIQIEDES